jgi:hypothetical protein
LSEPAPIWAGRLRNKLSDVGRLELNAVEDRAMLLVSRFEFVPILADKREHRSHFFRGEEILVPGLDRRGVGGAQVRAWVDLGAGRKYPDAPTAALPLHQKTQIASEAHGFGDLFAMSARHVVEPTDQLRPFAVNAANLFGLPLSLGARLQKVQALDHRSQLGCLCSQEPTFRLGERGLRPVCLRSGVEIQPDCRCS